MFIYGYLAIWLWNELQPNKIVDQVNKKKNSAEEDIQLNSKHTENSEDKKSIDNIKLNKAVTELVDSSKLHWIIRSFIFVYSEYKQPIKFHHLLSGVFLGIKNIVQTICLLSLTSEPTAQSLAVLACEVGYFTHYVISRPKASMSLMVTEISTQVCFIAYILLKAIAGIESLSDDTRQGGIGMAMSVFVFMSVGISLIFAAYSILMSIIQLVKSISTMLKNKRLHRVESKPNVKTPQGRQDVTVPNSIMQLIPSCDQQRIKQISARSPSRSMFRQIISFKKQNKT